MNRRMFPPANPGYSTRTVYGRTYVGAAGTPKTVPDSDAQLLEANGWSTVALSGSTAQRPVEGNVNATYRATPGMPFFDETLGQMISFAADGVWRDPVSGAQV